MITNKIPFIALNIGSTPGSSGATKKGVPQVLLIDEKGENSGVQGSYCWGEICVDYAIPSSRTDFREKLTIKRGSTINFRVVGYSYSDNFHVTIFSKEKIVLHTAVKKGLRLQILKGTYYLNAKATWERKGDVSNVFLIEVL